ncbi:hypothetical protein [Cylindrospermopsis raciborskii]|uniref:hypothetical protein n=2 Tax=Cylindrospermopsis raciborskii TaxID=77022 RepID=UPI0001C15D9F|nr:hypothetical protein [Cylindrospermopsis raciborskii]EFA69407.1 hypothetical protein CRC_02014 [Cylindrospermopsis raciborskii CS-505]PNK11644.1 hypothetical protein CEP09_16390 [Cylindrospermopsis raciborskii S06]
MVNSQQEASLTLILAYQSATFVLGCLTLKVVLVTLWLFPEMSIEMVPSTQPDDTQPVETTLLKDQEVGEPDVESLPDEKTQYKKKKKFYIFKRPYKFTLKGDIKKAPH